MSLTYSHDPSQMPMYKGPRAREGHSFSLTSPSRFYLQAWKIVSMACKISLRRLGSLRGSLINQDFITICTFTGKRHQAPISYQINITSYEISQVLIHSTQREKTEMLRFVRKNQQVNITFFVLFSSRKRAEKPNLQDGLCLEIVSYLLNHFLRCHNHSRDVYSLQRLCQREQNGACSNYAERSLFSQF